MRKTEVGPPNAWRSEPPPRNVRAPARNVIRTGLPGIAEPARALGNNPTKVEVWKLFFDSDIILQIVNFTNVKLALLVRKSLKEKVNPTIGIPTLKR